MVSKMTIGELKKRLNEFGTGADQCEVVLSTMSPSGRWRRYELVDLPFVLQTGELLVAFAPEGSGEL